MEKKSKQAGKKSKAANLRVTCTNGEIIQNTYAVQTLVEVIKRVGVEKVMRLKLPNRGLPLISKELFQDTNKTQYQKCIETGFYLYTKSSTNDKFVEIEMIRRYGEIEWIEIVDFV